MTQINLLELCERPPARAPRGGSHAENLSRCVAATAPSVLAFFAARPPGTRFHNKELAAFVQAQHPDVLFDTPRRVMCELRLAGLLNYALINRRQSLYEVAELPEAAKEVA